MRRKKKHKIKKSIELIAANFIIIIILSNKLILINKPIQTITENKIETKKLEKSNPKIILKNNSL